mmetsp:Transcript_12588/g.16541  ORF Transcript_12588/g.16541 Transcript_12588/m.16541 type:complete len:254 (+) Transcript_12588:162-923(+)|eukprot:CAMPEP_0198138540 /NCGR_PEP_ID=MMETSP1443-20131203/1931_1 /TAXON_ID=186043 /ORGANISM="Entomoneis sp., Strain CCMP2396" /LENGTH=253 /DNA_ID=CAMNT_0043800345 /DNA_START=90 /DNA_END=851 /DNA_ORIENTATION=-
MYLDVVNRGDDSFASLIPSTRETPKEPSNNNTNARRMIRTGGVPATALILSIFSIMLLSWISAMTPVEAFGVTTYSRSTVRQRQRQRQGDNDGNDCSSATTTIKTATTTTMIKMIIHTEDFDQEIVGDDAGGVSLDDLSWRVEKMKLEENNIQRFLKARPRFLPYDACRKWVQAWGNRWETAQDWEDWIDMGEKRNAYIPSRPDEYYGRLGEWVSWDHFLLEAPSHKDDDNTTNNKNKDDDSCSKNDDEKLSE